MTPTTADRGLGGGTHACLVHDSPAALVRALEAHLAGAFEDGKRVVVLAESADDQLTRDVLTRTGHGDRAGQVDVRGAHDIYAAHGTFDPGAMLAQLEADKRAALADGFTGVHIVADMSWAAADPRALDLLPAYERAANSVFADGRATAVCQYDRTRFPAMPIAACAAAHPLLETAFEEAETLADARASITVGRHGTVRAEGEIDMANVELFERALALAASRSDDVCVDASDLTFIDVRGVNALFDAARGQGIALLAASSPLRGMLDAVDAPRQLPELHSE